MTTRMRLDALLVHKGLVESREKARALILAGQVDVGGHGAHKAGTLVHVEADVHVIGPDHPWVSRGGLKLAHALDVFAVDVAGVLALDIGASTGGFTDVLLQRGARHVIALGRRTRAASLETAAGRAGHGDRGRQRALSHSRSAARHRSGRRPCRHRRVLHLAHAHLPRAASAPGAQGAR